MLWLQSSVISDLTRFIDLREISVSVLLIISLHFVAISVSFGTSVLSVLDTDETDLHDFHSQRSLR